MPKKRRGLMFGYKFTRPSMARRGLLAVLLLCARSAALAQATSPAPSNPPPVQPDTPFAYEVVSVKHYEMGNANGVSSGWQTTKDGFLATGVTLEVLVMSAFGLLNSDQIEGLPPWAGSAQFAVEAKMDESTAVALEHLPLPDRGRAQDRMMQSLLADRFTLKAHHESRERLIYDLVLAKGGSKLQETPSGVGSAYSLSNGVLVGHGISIDQLVFSLTGSVGRYIVDKTGLTGRYDMTLNWTPDEEAGTASAGPSIFTALEEQLGLKLVSAKGPVDTIVIDHVEKPSQN
jgi:uncharacterized protein (TIGR03435 family)